MSLIFTNYDRTQMCNHDGMLGRTLDDGSRMCVRCGKTVGRPHAVPKAETFTRPVGRVANRRSSVRKVG